MFEHEMTRCEGIEELEKAVEDTHTFAMYDWWYNTVKAEYVAEGLALFWVTGFGQAKLFKLRRQGDVCSFERTARSQKEIDEEKIYCDDESDDDEYGVESYEYFDKLERQALRRRG